MSTTFAVDTTPLQTPGKLHDHVATLTGGPHTLHFNCPLCRQTGQIKGPVGGMVPCPAPLCRGLGRWAQEFPTVDALRGFVVANIRRE